MIDNWETKDSGVRAEYNSGMVRDTSEGKARFDLLLPKGVPYAQQMLTRFANLMARGAKKYTERNWEKARGQEELDRYHESAFRHLMQWVAGEDDEDHAAAVMFNLMAGEHVESVMSADELDPEYEKPTNKRGLEAYVSHDDHFDTEAAIEAWKIRGDYNEYDGIAISLAQEGIAQTSSNENDLHPISISLTDEALANLGFVPKNVSDVSYSDEADFGSYTCGVTAPHRCRVHPNGIEEAK